MYFGHIEKDTEKNVFFRKVIHTGKHMQLVLMTLKPTEEIGEEVHGHVDQFFRVESGSAKFVINGKETIATDGDAVIVNAGEKHNVLNNGSGALKLYTIYAPPNHPSGTIHKTKAEADEAEEHEHH
jgi:mannose-6-phosphate isomerase-like protein (cupin superfamily)